MKQLAQIIMYILVTIVISAQDIDVAGKAIIRTMDTDSLETNLVVKQSDGTLAIRNLGSIQGVDIGDFYQGGIVFYTYDNGLHGLIMSTEEIGDSIQWSPDKSIFQGLIPNMMANPILII